MIERHGHCSDERLLGLLRADEDTDAQQAAAHLEACPRCRDRLESLAAQSHDWQLARDCLVADDFEDAEPDNNSRRDNHGPRDWPGSMRRRRAPSAWSETLAKQLLAPPSHPEMLGRIGRYEVERVLGAGGMGVVFKAFDTELNRPVAVKVLAPYLAGSGAARKRFAREARAAAAIVHEHVVPIHNVDTDGEWPFLVMHYVAGESLQQRLDRAGPLDPCEILRIGLQTAAGLAAAHAQGIVHRDVKPSNILLEQGIERAWLTDFGLAHASDDANITFTGYHPGTPQYMSPEQARGEPVDARSDLFSLGSVFYALCTGRPPFRAETSYGVLRRITDHEPRPVRELNPAIPEWLEAIVAKLLAKHPAERFESAEQVAKLCERCLAHLQQPTTTPLPAWCCMVGRKATQGDTWKTARTICVQEWRRWLEPSNARTARWMFGGVVALSVALAGGWYLFGRGDLSRGDLSTKNSPVEDTAPGQSASALPGLAWDDVARDVADYRDDLAPFEVRSQQSWDDVSSLDRE